MDLCHWLGGAAPDEYLQRWTLREIEMYSLDVAEAMGDEARLLIRIIHGNQAADGGSDGQANAPSHDGVPEWARRPRKKTAKQMEDEDRESRRQLMMLAAKGEPIQLLADD